MIRVTQSRNGSWQQILVEGTLSDGWVEALGTSWLEARSQSNGRQIRIDLSGVTYVDDRGRELLARMIRSGAKLRATGIMTRAVVEEIKDMIARDRVNQAAVTKAINASRPQRATSRKRSKNVSPPTCLRPRATR